VPKVEPFNQHLEEYEHWFTVNSWVYESELEAIRKVLPTSGRGIEIGIGSGLFASPLGIREGVDPSAAMREKAHQRGLEVQDAVAEALPYADESVDHALMVTSICFVDSIPKSLLEARRVLRPGGLLVIAFVDKDSFLGRQYQIHKHENPFYREAIFVGASELDQKLDEAGFAVEEFWQTIFSDLDQVQSLQEAIKGHGEGGFVVISARKPL